MTGPRITLDDEKPPREATPRRRRSLVEALADLVSGRTNPFEGGEADLSGTPERPRAALPTLEPEAQARTAEAPALRRAPERPMRPRMPRFDDFTAAPSDATRVAGAASMGPTGPETVADSEQRVVRRRAQLKDVAEENFSPEKLREIATRQRAVAANHRALGQNAEADEQERQAENAEVLARAAERADTPGAILLSNLTGLVHDPYAGERRTLSEAREPGMIASEREQRGLGIDRPTAPNRGTDIAKDYLYPMAGQVVPLVAGGAAGRAVVGAAGEALQGVRGARTIGQALSRSAQVLEPAVAAGPQVPLRVNATARLAEELEQFRRAAPTLMARGATEGQIVGGAQAYRMAREQGATPEQAFGAAVEGMAISIPLGMAAELGFGAAGRVARAGVESAHGMIRDAAEAAGDFARARPSEQADAVHKMTTMERVTPALEMIGRDEQVRRMVEEERAVSATRNQSVAEALGQVPAVARDEANPVATVAKEYQAAVNSYIDALAEAETVSAEEQRPGTKLQIKLARARTALDEMRRQYGQQAGVASIVALANANEDLTDDEKNMVGLGGIAFAGSTAIVRAIPAEVKTAIVNEMGAMVRAPTGSSFFGTGTPDQWLAHFKKAEVPGFAEHATEIAAILKRAANAPDSNGILTSETVAEALSGGAQVTRAPLRSRMIETIQGLPKAWDQPRPAGDWIGKLKGSNTLAKAELDLLMPMLERARELNQKLDRATVMEHAEVRAPRVKQVTLQETPSSKSGGRATVEVDVDGIDDIDEIESNLGDAEWQPGRHQLPSEGDRSRASYIEGQQAIRRDRIAELEGEIDNRISRARGEMDDAQELVNKRRSEIEDTLNHNFYARDLERALDKLNEYVEGEDFNRDGIARALELLTDNIYPDDEQMLEILNDHGYTVVEDKPDPKRREWMLVKRGSNGTWSRIAGFEHDHFDIDNDPGITAAYRRQQTLINRYGENYAEQGYAIRRQTVAEYKADHPAGEPEWVVLDHNGKEKARGVDKESVVREVVFDDDLDQQFRDDKYEQLDRDLSDYGEAVANYNRAESEHYYLSEDTDNAFEEELDEIERHRESLGRLGALLGEEMRNPPSLASRAANAVRGLLGGGEKADKGVMADGTQAPAENPYLMPLEPVVSGDPKYASYQRIGGGRNYRELINVWANNPGEKFTEGHFSRTGAISGNDIGHVRAEDHMVVQRPGITDAPLIVHDQFQPSDRLLAERTAKDAGDVVRHLIDAINEKRKARDAKLAEMAEIARAYERLPADQRETGPVANDLAMRYKEFNQHAIDLAKRASELEDDLMEATEYEATPGSTDPIAVMIESQTDWGQDAHESGVKSPEVQREIDNLADIVAGHKEEAGRARERANRAAVAWNDALVEHSEGRAGPDVVSRAAQEKYAAEEEHANAVQRLNHSSTDLAQARESLSASAVPPSPFLGDKGEGQAAFRLNAARFLIDSAERGYGRLAWSDAANRVKNAHLPLQAAINVYDKYTPAAIKALLNGLGFKDVPITKLFIRGEGHWSIDFPPAMREAIRRYGLPTLGLMALTGQEAEAQDSDSSTQNSDGPGLGTALGATVAAAAIAYTLGSRRARLLARQTPEVKAALEQAVSAVTKYKKNHPEFAFPRREPIGVEYDAPIDVAETPTGDGPAQFNVAKIGLSAEGETVWRKIVGDLALKKRYVSWDATNKAAAERVPTIDDLLGEKPWSGTDALAARMFQAQASERLAALAKELPTKTDDEQLLVRAEMDRVATDIADMATRAAGEREAAGRTLNAYKIIARSNMDEATWQTLAQRAKGDVPLTGDEILKVRGLISRADREQLTQFVSSLHKSSAVDKWLTLWKAGLLTAIPTHAINILSNAAETATIAASQPAAVAIDALTALVRGTERERTLSGAFSARIKGAFAGLRESKQIMKTGVSDAELGKWDARRTNYDSPIFQAYTDVVFRSLAAADRPFYHAARQVALDELTTLAAQQAAKFDPTLKFDEVKTALMEDPSNEIANRASEEALRAVFQNEGTLASVAAGGMATLRGGGKGRAAARLAAETVLPFTRTPSNVASRFVDTTPLGLVTAINRQLGGPFNQRQFSGDVARALTGSGGLMLLGYWLAENGMATGTSPTDPGDREVWKSQGKQANSIRLGDRWYNVARLGPPGMTVAAGAAYHDMVKAHPDNALAIAGGMAGTVGKITADQSFLLGLSRGIETLTDPMKRGESFTSGLAGSVVPAGVARVAQAADDTKREANTAGERIRARLPGASRSLRPQLNVFGDEMKRTKTDRAVALADPFFSSRAEDQPILAEVERLGIGIPPMTKMRKLSDPASGERFEVRYTDAERHAALQEHVGPRRREFLENLMTSESYAAMPDQARAKAIRKALDDANDEFYGRDDAARIRARAKPSMTRSTP